MKKIMILCTLIILSQKIVMAQVLKEDIVADFKEMLNDSIIRSISMALWDEAILFSYKKNINQRVIIQEFIIKKILEEKAKILMLKNAINGRQGKKKTEEFMYQGLSILWRLNGLQRDTLQSNLPELLKKYNWLFKTDL
jgi:hypothetical protein